MPLYSLEGPLPDLVAPVVIAAFDGWVDAGSAATAVLDVLGDGAPVIARFDADQLYDYRSRRPTLTIRNGRLDSLDWPELTLRAARFDDRDLLVLTGEEPDDRWHQLAADTVELLASLGASQWISLGAIPAAVAHTRAGPSSGPRRATDCSAAASTRGRRGSCACRRAALSMLKIAVAESGVPSVGYFAQIPHYVSGPYALAALELLRALERHLDVVLPRGDLEAEGRQLRQRLDAATAADDTTRQYVEKLEAMIDEERQPSGDDLIAEIEQFLRGQGRRRTVLAAGGPSWKDGKPSVPARGGPSPSGRGSWRTRAPGSRGPRRRPARRPARTRPRSGSRRCPASQPGLVRDRADEVARAHPGRPARADEQAGDAGPRPRRGGPGRPGRPSPSRHAVAR